jgi:hypothetical protein
VAHPKSRGLISWVATLLLVIGGPVFILQASGGPRTGMVFPLLLTAIGAWRLVTQLREWSDSVRNSKE